MRAFNVKALQQLRFMGLNDTQVISKEWAIRLMANVVDFGEQREASVQLLAHLLSFDDPVSKSEVARLIKTLLGLLEETDEAGSAAATQGED